MFVLNRLYLRRLEEFETEILERARRRGWTLRSASAGTRGWRTRARALLRRHLSLEKTTVVAGLVLVGLILLQNLRVDGWTDVSVPSLGWPGLYQLGLALGLVLPAFYAAHFLAHYVQTWAEMGDWVYQLLAPEAASGGSPAPGLRSWEARVQLARHVSGVFFRGFVQVVLLLVLAGWLHLLLVLATDTIPGGAFGLVFASLMAGIVYLVGPSWETDLQIRRHRDRQLHKLLHGEADASLLDVDELSVPLLDAREGSPIAAATLVCSALGAFAPSF